MITMRASEVLRAYNFGVLHYDELAALRSILATHIETVDLETGEDLALLQKLEARLDGELLGMEMARLEKAKAA